jgi:hypothetical protein
MERSVAVVIVTLAGGQELRLDDGEKGPAPRAGLAPAAGPGAEAGETRVPWARFRRAELTRPNGSGPGYGDFAPPKRLRGTVTDADGTRRAGLLHVDLDAAESWELLEGTSDGITYSIPFSRIRSMERSGAVVIVTLAGGEELRLDDGEKGAGRPVGVVVEAGTGAEAGEIFVPWRDLRRIDLDR